MRLEWIEDILAVLDTGSFAGAAGRRFLTPSAFTRRIRGIETALGCQLFDRQRKPVALLPHVARMEPELREAARRLREVRLGLSDREAACARRLTLGCQHALSTTVAPCLARRLGSGRNLGMRIRSGTRADCHLMLLRQEADIGLIYETAEDALQFDTRFFDKITLGMDALIPVANPGISDIAAALRTGELPLVTYPSDIHLGEVVRVNVMPRLPRGVTGRSVAETGLTPAVLQFVRQGLGIGWLPRSVAQEALMRGELTDLSGRLPETVLTVRAVRARAGDNGPAGTAWTNLRKIAAELSVAGISKAPA